MGRIFSLFSLVVCCMCVVCECVCVNVCVGGRGYNVLGIKDDRVPQEWDIRKELRGGLERDG